MAHSAYQPGGYLGATQRFLIGSLGGDSRHEKTSEKKEYRMVLHAKLLKGIALRMALLET